MLVDNFSLRQDRDLGATLTASLPRPLPAGRVRYFDESVGPVLPAFPLSSSATFTRVHACVPFPSYHARLAGRHMTSKGYNQIGRMWVDDIKFDMVKVEWGSFKDALS